MARSNRGFGGVAAKFAEWGAYDTAVNCHLSAVAAGKGGEEVGERL